MNQSIPLGDTGGEESWAVVEADDRRLSTDATGAKFYEYN